MVSDFVHHFRKWSKNWFKKNDFLPIFVFLYFCIFASTSTDNFSVICLCRINFCTNFEFSELSAFRIWYQILSIIFKNGQKMYLKKMIFPIFFMYSFTVCNSRGCFQLLSYWSLWEGTVLYSTVLYSTVQYCTVLYCTVLYYTVLWLSGWGPKGPNVPEGHPLWPKATSPPQELEKGPVGPNFSSIQILS